MAVLSRKTQAFIGLVTLVLGFIGTLLKDAYLGVFIVIVLLLVYLLGLSVSLIFSAIKKRYRTLGCAGVLSVLLIVSIALTNPTARDFIVRALYSIRQAFQIQYADQTIYGNGPVTIQRITMGESQDAYKLIVTLHNALAQEVLVKNFRMIEKVPPTAACAGGGSTTLELSDTFNIVRQSSKTLDTVGEVSDQANPGISYEVRVSIANGLPCFGMVVDIGFDTTFNLESSNYTDLIVTFPKRLKVVSEDTAVFPFLGDPTVPTLVVTASPTPAHYTYPLVLIPKDMDYVLYIGLCTNSQIEPIASLKRIIIDNPTLAAKLNDPAQVPPPNFSINAHQSCPQ